MGESDVIGGKRVAVTGAGGSIGSELASRLIEMDAQALLLVDNSEVALWRQMGKFEGLPVDCRFGDVRDYQRMCELFTAFQPQVVFHAAAMKHVPICERNAREADKTNRLGTAYVAVAASDAGANVVVLISTDKAVDPVCVLGRTKAEAESFMSGFNHETEACRFASVRFHNVLGSSGSVVHSFATQIAAGGPLTVTHPDMVRWFATPREACDLLIRCAGHAAGPDGLDLYALNVGKPTRIIDLASSMIETADCADSDAGRDKRDIKIRFVGLRPGERLNEKLVGEEEEMVDVGIDGIIGIRRRVPDAAGGSADGPTCGEEGAAEGQAPEPEAARA